VARAEPSGAVRAFLRVVARGRGSAVGSGMVHPRAIVAGVVALALATPARASEPVAAAPVDAPPSAYDTVQLRDGTLLRGTIVELAPGKDVVIAVPGVGTRTIAWAEVVSTGFAGRGDSSDRPAGSPEGPVPEDIEPTPGPSRPRITIELARQGEVHLLEAGWPAQAGYRPNRSIYSAARSVCRAPCDRVIDGSAGNPFFFGGSRTVPSRIFYLKDLEGDYVARVKPGRIGLLLGGAGAFGLGYAGTLTGGLLVGLTRDDDTRLAGGIVLGAGLALLAASIAMLVRGTTRYTLRRR
jgi:hypothetical protein